MNVLLNSLLAKYKPDKPSEGRMHALYFTSIFLYLNERFNESMSLLESVEKSIFEHKLADELLPDVFILKTLIYKFSAKFEKAKEQVNDLIIFAEKDNIMFLKRLGMTKFSDFCVDEQLPGNLSSKGLHSILLLADLALLQQDKKKATQLLSRYSSLTQGKIDADTVLYYFHLQMSMAKTEKISDRDLFKLTAYIKELLESHAESYPYFYLEYTWLLFSFQRFPELSEYQLDHDWSHFEGIPKQTNGHGLDANDFDPATRFCPWTNPSLANPALLSSLLRIKLSPVMMS